MRPAHRSVCAFAAFVLVAATALAQTKAKPARGGAPPARTKTTHAAPSRNAAPAPAASAAPATAPTEPDTTPTTNVSPMSGRAEAKTAGPPAAAKDTGGKDAGVTVVDKDGGSKKFKFGETDIEGRLKAPQLVYFLRRVRAEFAAGDLGHRSFLQELSETRQDQNF